MNKGVATSARKLLRKIRKMKVAVLLKSECRGKKLDGLVRTEICKSIVQKGEGRCDLDVTSRKQQ